VASAEGSSAQFNWSAFGPRHDWGLSGGCSGDGKAGQLLVDSHYQAAQRWGLCRFQAFSILP
jgi:hypothetical protein